MNNDIKIDNHIGIKKNLKLYDQKVTLSIFFMNITISPVKHKKND